MKKTIKKVTAAKTVSESVSNTPTEPKALKATATKPAIKKATSKSTTSKTTTPAKKPAVKKPVSKKTAAAGASTKKAAAKKTVAKKRATSSTVESKAEAPVSKKSRSTRKSKVIPKSPLYLDNDEYNACMEGLMSQGIDREDAIETLKVGIRQANGRPVPLELLRPHNTPVLSEATA